MKNYYQIANKLRKFLTYNPGERLTIRAFSEISIQIGWLVRFFYLFVCYWLYAGASKLYSVSLFAPTDPVWLIEMIWEPLLKNNGVLLVSIFLPLSLATAMYPRSVILRISMFIAILLRTAYGNSFGSMNHGFYFLLFVSFMLLFLPDKSMMKSSLRRIYEMRMLAVFWLIQAMLLFFYSLSGIQKLIRIGLKLFSPDTLARITLEASFTFEGEPILWEPLIAAYPVAFQLMHPIVVYVQAISILILFRPQLHRAYGVVLILFHFGTYYMMHIRFDLNVIVWGLFFLYSPFTSKKVTALHMLQSLPFFGWFFRQIKSKYSNTEKISKEGWLVYDGECPFCNRYAEYMNLKNRLRALHLVNARDDHPLVKEVVAKGFDLDEGMVLKFDDSYYYGEKALSMISILSNSSGIIGFLNSALFSNSLGAKIAYPALKFGRRLTLKLIRVSMINESKKSS